MEMTEDLIADLADKIAARLVPAKNSPYCTTAEIAAMLYRTTSYVRTTYITRPDFPRPINLPVRGTRSVSGHDLWKLDEVHEWVENFQRKARRTIPI